MPSLLIHTCIRRVFRLGHLVTILSPFSLLPSARCNNVHCNRLFWNSSAEQRGNCASFQISHFLFYAVTMIACIYILQRADQVIRSRERALQERIVYHRTVLESAGALLKRYPASSNQKSEKAESWTRGLFTLACGAVIESKKAIHR